MDLIIWDDESMNTGIGLIDTQHKKLCDIVNSFGNAINRNEEDKILYDIVEELIDYTQYHFSVEEEFFDKFDFPQKDLHKSEHKYFIEYFNNIKNDLDKDTKKRNKPSVDLTMDMLKFLVEWFITHITGSDREYIELFKKNGII